MSYLIHWVEGSAIAYVLLRLLLRGATFPTAPTETISTTSTQTEGQTT